MKNVIRSVFVLGLALAFAAGLSFAGETKGRKANGDKWIIGYSYPTINNEFWVNSLTGIQNAAKELGFELIEIPCNNDQAKQVNDADSMIASGIDALILAPQDASVCPGIVSQCNARGIPVIIVDRWPGDSLAPGKDYIAFIGPNDTEAGYSITQTLIDSGCKKLVGIGGFQSTSVGEDRKVGLDKALADNPNAQLLQYEWAGESWDDGDRVFRSILSAHRDLDGVWCYNDSLALASVNVLKENGLLGKVKVGGMDLLEPAVESMLANELFFSTGGHYMQSAFGSIVLFDTLNGFPYQGKPITKLTLMDVSQDNVKRFKTEYLDNPTAVNWKGYSKVFNPDAKADFKPVF